MNKKFSTLMAGLVLATGVASAQTYISPDPFTFNSVPTNGGFPYRTMNTKVNAAFASPFVGATLVNKIESENKWYQLTDGAGEDNADAKVLIQVRDEKTGDVTLKMVKPIEAKAENNAPLNYSLWKIKVSEHPTTAAKVYTFINKETNLELVLDDTNALNLKKLELENVDDQNKTILSGCSNQWAWYDSDALTDGTFSAKAPYTYFHNSDSVMVMELNSDAEVVAVKYSKADASDGAGNGVAKTKALKLMPVIAQAVTLTAADLNAMIDAQEIKTLNPADSAKFKFSVANGKLDAALQTLSGNVLASEKGFKAYDQYLFREFGKAGLLAISTDLTAGETMLKNVAAAFTAVKSDAKATSAADYATAATTAEAAAKAAAKTAKDKADEIYKIKVTAAKTATAIAADFATQFEAGAAALGETTTDESVAKALTTAKTNAQTILAIDGIAATTKTAMNSLVKNIDGYLKDVAAAQARAAKGQEDMPLTLTWSEDVTTEPFNAFGIRLVDENSKYFMVDTLRFEENEAPSLSPAYMLATEKFGDNIKADGAYYAARYFFRVTYYPSNDSLAIEPLNAASKSNEEAIAKKTWLESKAGSQWVKASDINIADGDAGMTVSNTDVNTKTVETESVVISPIAITASKLSDGSTVATVGPQDPFGSFRTRVSFNHVYPYLVRSTEDPGLYSITLVTNDPNANAETRSRVNGSYIIADMSGKLVYAKKDKSQDYSHMPATQWVVENIGCLKPNNNVARVKVTNREYSHMSFEGQLYEDANGNKYIINRNYDKFGNNNKFYYRDTLKFAPVTDTKKGYLILKKDTLSENTYAFNQFLDYGTDPYFLNVKGNKADTLLRAQEEATQFELFVVGADSIKYGYTSAQAGVSQLWRTAYQLKVKDANKIDNDRKYVAVDQYNKYVVATEKDIKDKVNGLRPVNFYFKENNHWVEGAEGKEYYALVDVDKPASEVILTANGDAKLAIETGQMDTKPEALGESRTEAFYIGKDNRPLYRSLGKKNSVVKIYTERGTAKEYLYEDGSNKINYPSAIKDFNYLGITSAGITPDGEGTTVALYADYVKKSNDRMPQYLFAVDIDSVKAYTWCKDHGLNPTCTHADTYAGYVAGRYLVNLNDSVDTSINKLQDAAKFKYDNYTRLAFVEAVHRGDSLYVLKNGTKLESLMAKDPSGKSYILPANLDEANKGKVYDIVDLKGQHNNAAFSLRLVDDGEAQDFYLESNGKDSGIGSFKGAWVKLQNYVPVLAQTTKVNGEHDDDDTGSILETINQAQKFNIDENVDETPTDSKTPEVSTISVNADYGKVIIKGAAGKTVTITNVLGQTIANTVISSNEATISASAGLVVVSVEGEEAVKAIVK